MSIFGWDLPPGCSVRDIPGNGPETPCPLCMEEPDYCTCDECPECSTFGCLEHADWREIQRKWEAADYQARELGRALDERAQTMKRQCPTCGTEHTPDLKTFDQIWCDKCQRGI